MLLGDISGNQTIAAACLPVILTLAYNMWRVTRKDRDEKEARAQANKKMTEQETDEMKEEIRDLKAELRELKRDLKAANETIDRLQREIRSLKK